MHVEAEVTYPATAEVVARMLADPDFARARCAAMHPLAHSASVQGTADGAFTMTTLRTMPTDDFPDAARRFVGDSVELRQVDSWGPPAPDGSRTGTLVVEITGAPVRLSADQHLEPSGSGCTERVSGELRASVPLVGGRLERAAEPAVMSAIRVEERVGRDWLARGAG